MAIVRTASLIVLSLALAAKAEIDADDDLLGGSCTEPVDD